MAAILCMSNHPPSPKPPGDPSGSHILGIVRSQSTHKCICGLKLTVTIPSVNSTELPAALYFPSDHLKSQHQVQYADQSVCLTEGRQAGKLYFPHIVAWKRYKYSDAVDHLFRINSFRNNFSILKRAILLNFWQLFMINVENILFIFFLKN